MGTVAVAATAGALLLGGNDADDEADPAGQLQPPSTSIAPTSPTSPSAASPAEPAPASSAAAPAGLRGDAELASTVREATGADRTPGDARAALRTLLTARADATIELLRAAWQEDTASAARATQTLASASEGLAAVVSTWQDPVLAERLRTGLDQQSAAGRAYAAAVTAGDGAAADRARAVMGEVSRALGAELARVTDGRIATYVPPQDAGRYRSFVDALQAGDTAAAQRHAEWLRARLGREGEALGAGVAGSGLS